jgi:hypothetical protein
MCYVLIALPHLNFNKCTRFAVMLDTSVTYIDVEILEEVAALMGFVLRFKIGSS